MGVSKKDINTDSLLRPLSIENLSESLWSDKCDYWLAEECDNLNPSNYNFIVLQWNIHSLMSNVKELKLLLDKLDRKHSTIDIVLLCEMFLAKDSEKLLHIPNYKLYANNRKEHKGGGTATLVQEGITHKRPGNYD